MLKFQKSFLEVCDIPCISRSRKLRTNSAKKKNHQSSGNVGMVEILVTLRNKSVKNQASSTVNRVWGQKTRLFGYMAAKISLSAEGIMSINFFWGIIGTFFLTIHKSAVDLMCRAQMVKGFVQAVLELIYYTRILVEFSTEFRFIFCIHFAPSLKLDKKLAYLSIRDWWVERSNIRKFLWYLSTFVMSSKFPRYSSFWICL